MPSRTSTHSSGGPDLLNPYLPDMSDLDNPSKRSIPVDHGGMSVRSTSVDAADLDWPDSGPSSQPMQSGKEPNIGPFGAKVIAAMTGATVTSLLMTPFDVLKTRLQTVQPKSQSSSINFGVNPIRPSSECCQTSLLTPPAASPRRLGKAKQIPYPSNPLTCFTSTSPDELSRTQTVRPGPARAAFSSLPVPAPGEPPQGCAFPSKWAGIWGEAVSLEEALARNVRMASGGLAMAGGEGTATLVLPLQGTMSREAIKRGGFWGEVAAVRSEVGVKGLWKGVGTALTMSIPSAAIYMIGYEYLLTIISPRLTNSTDPRAHLSSMHRKPGSSQAGTTSFTAAPLIAGALARTISATTISPMEMFRTRLQALPSQGVSPSYASVFKDMNGLVKAESVAVLWRGLGPTLWRDVPFSGIYWAGFEILKTNLSSSTSPLPNASPLTISFLSGAMSGTISALVTQPFDVLKTRRQVFTPSKDCNPAALRHRASTLPLAMHVIKTEGWGALFAGTVPRCGKVAPACGLMIACYEGVGRYLGGGRQGGE